MGPVMRKVGLTPDLGPGFKLRPVPQLPVSAMKPKPDPSLLVAVLAGVGASLCCVAPFLLVLAGLGGAWLSWLTALQPFRPLFVVLALAALAIGFYRLHFRPCDPDGRCADPRVRKRQRLIFWSVALFLLLFITFPWYGARLFS